MKMLLFDIDGTLLLSGGAGDRALAKALKKHHGVDKGLGPVMPHGKTDPAILREMFQVHLGRAAQDGELQEMCDSYACFLAEELPVSSAYRVMPGVAELIPKLAANPDNLLGLITGNLAQTAPLKLQRAGLNRYFRFGGYATDSEDRAELTRIGIQRGRALAGMPIPNEEIFLIGDTPHDIAAGKKAGVVTIAVATGPWSVEDLRSHHPDHLFGDLTDTAAVYRALGI